MEKYTAPDGRVITLVPVHDLREARTFLVRWLVLFAMTRKAQHLADVCWAEGLDAARREGYKMGVFVD